jgi:hypothetical protein
MVRPGAEGEAATATFRRWFRGIGWPAAMMAAWLIFELTASDALTAVALCSKFGWPDLATAFWLRRRDPVRRRGEVCFWYYLASALWKTSIPSFFAMVGLLYAVTQFGGVPLSKEYFQTMLAMLCISFGCASLATFFAFVQALSSGTKVWVEDRVGRARRESAWPPTPCCRVNRAGFLLVMSFVAIGTPAMLTVIIGSLALLFPRQIGRQGETVYVVCSTAVICASIVSLPFVVLMVADRLNRKVVALAPEECWGS